MRWSGSWMQRGERIARTLEHGLRWLCFASFATMCACANPTRVPQSALTTHEAKSVRPALSAPPPADPVSCGPDTSTRAPAASSREGFDLDGDTELDLVFAEPHDMHGNSAFHLYRSEGACAVYLGSVVAFMSMVPHCDTPAVDGRVCRLGATRRMFHDDYQQTLYQHSPSGFVEVGRGRYTPAPASGGKRGR